MYVKKVIKWIVVNRRILGTICGSILVVLGHEKEGAYITDISTHL